MEPLRQTVDQSMMGNGMIRHRFFLDFVAEPVAAPIPTPMAIQKASPFNAIGAAPNATSTPTHEPIFMLYCRDW
jgi:hypothetical protein